MPFTTMSMFGLLAIVMVQIISLNQVYGSLVNGVESVLESNPGREKKSFRVKRSSGTPEPFTEAERLAGLALNNKHRSEQGASDMKYMEWHPELARMAQDYTEGCLYEHSSQLNNGCYNVTYDSVGENLQYSTGKVPLTTAVTAWFNEEKDYDYDSATCAEGQICNHYRQVLWAKSGLIGCGRAFCAELKENAGTVAKNAYLISCNYGVRGNYGQLRPFKTGTACSACEPEMKACKDNMCYHEGADYQRPANKLKDCGPKTGSNTDGGGGGDKDGGDGGDKGAAGCITTFPGYSYLTILLLVYTLFSSQGSQ